MTYLQSKTNQPGVNASAAVMKGTAHMITFRDTVCLLDTVANNMLADASSVDNLP